MRLIFSTTCAVLWALATVPAKAGPDTQAHMHDAPAFSAGEPGDAQKSSRVIQVTMQEHDGKMLFVPDRIEVEKGEQIKFMLHNIGELEHEFVLADTEENLEHAEMMMKNPEMRHVDPNARRVAPKQTDEIVWKFTKAGEFEFACLIPGHRDAGMFGVVEVK
ncbi:cupredoxin family protein [Methylocapsa polymorpha]|uniref:Cupredoxin family protein n=1 Tax=Methylocapsa polymorpha TaxID=3080828 RepID=A0ABZ0HST4_9HYPH|nr:cupredoxin family protein [Methylocapsa sp. RX1]